MAEGNFFSLVAHQYWGVWALIQARYSPIDFDYFGYSRLRWDEYHRAQGRLPASSAASSEGIGALLTTTAPDTM